jgi:uncharacterized membrane protein YeaQ/YmgE (transglycosylase-associated protein family)
MGLLLAIIFGALAGWIASMLMRGGSDSLLMDIVLGILGSVVGSLVMNALGQPGTSGFNLYSLFVSVLGAVLLIALGRTFRRAF